MSEPIRAKDIRVAVEGTIVKGLNTFRFGSNSPVTKVAVFDEDRPYVVLDDDEDTFSFGGFLRNDPGQTALRAAAKNKTEVTVTVTFNGNTATGGFSQKVRVSAREISGNRDDKFVGIAFTCEGTEAATDLVLSGE